MREFCDYADTFISAMDDDEVACCGFMPESCHCIDCPSFRLVEVSNNV